MKTKCTLIGNILSLISNPANIIFNGIVIFVLWLIIGIGSSLSGENVSTLETNLNLLFLISVLILSIINVCFGSIVLAKHRSRVLALRIILLSFLFITMLCNILLIAINLSSYVCIIFGIFALFNLTSIILNLIDVIKNRNIKTLQTAKGQEPLNI